MQAAAYTYLADADWTQRIAELERIAGGCELCPRRCRVNRFEEGLRRFWLNLSGEFLAACCGVIHSETPCYAWALMPNHFHLLLRTGNAPIFKVLSRLLRGYAGSFNWRHRRSAHLFQNRYKSILCQEDIYLLELGWRHLRA
jgi:REP element-mobilizing transposase RayT